MSNEVSVKETKEMINGLKEGFKAGKAVRDIVKEGFDIVKTIELIKGQVEKIDIYSAAIKDADVIKDEIKDLSKEEMVELFLELVSAVSEVEKV